VRFGKNGFLPSKVIISLKCGKIALTTDSRYALSIGAKSATLNDHVRHGIVIYLFVFT